MINYEVTFIVDPVLSGDEISATAQTYVDLLKNEGCNIVHVNEMGLRQLAYEINRRQSGVYYCVEFETEKGDFLDNMELSLRRDERIMRFLTVRLDKFGVKYNEDKRKGLIGKKKTNNQEKKRDENERERTVPAPKGEAPAPKEEKTAPVVATAAPKEEKTAVATPAPKEETPVSAVTTPAPVEETPVPTVTTPDVDAENAAE